nr:immunoglobulin heavy chain junction region [Macaca mulatta]
CTTGGQDFVSFW